MDINDVSGFTDAMELRVLHGPQAGSTLPMEDGQSYLLGTADTCAVLLAGTQVEAEHAALVADAHGIHVTPLGGKVMTLERSELAAGDVVPLGTVLRLGRVKLTVDSVDAPWPQDEALEELEPAPAPVPAAETAQQAPEEPALDGTPPPAVAMPVKARARRSRSLAPAVLLGGAAMLLMGAAVAAWVTAEQQELPAIESAKAAEAAGPAVQGTPEPAAAPASAAVRLMPPAERLAAVTRFVEKHRVEGELALRAQQNGAGALRIVGAAASPAKLATVVEAARSELAEAGPVEFAVLMREELPARFEERLRAAGLAPKFKVVRREPQLELQASLTGPEVLAWENTFKEFAREYGSVLPVVAEVRQERDTLEIQIETVVGGAFPYVVTTGGRRIAPGGVLQGRTLVAIRDGELHFSDGSRVRWAH